MVAHDFDDMAAFTAVVLAGERGPDSPVAQAAGVCCKALAPVDGQAMLLRVVGALASSREIAGCLVSGPRSLQAAVPTAADLTWLESRETPATSAGAALAQIPDEQPVLLTTADHALLSADMIDYFCQQARATGADMAVGLARADMVAKALPEARYTRLSLHDDSYTSCNLFAFLTPDSRSLADFWRCAEGARKRPWRIAHALGWQILLGYLSGRLDLSEALARLSRRTEVTIEAVILPFAEAAVDVDTVADWHTAQGLAQRR